MRIEMRRAVVLVGLCWALKSLAAVESGPGVAPLPGDESGPGSYCAPYAFDFGTENSPIRKGFQRVAPNTEYAPESGFGWRTGADVLSMAVPAARDGDYDEYYRAKMKPVTYFSTLTQDCAGGHKNAELLVSLPPGKYELYVLAGCSGRYQCKVLAGSDADFPVGPTHCPGLALVRHAREDIVQLLGVLGPDDYRRHRGLCQSPANGVLRHFQACLTRL